MPVLFLNSYFFVYSPDIKLVMLANIDFMVLTVCIELNLFNCYQTQNL